MWELYLRVKLHVAVQFPSQVVCPSSPPLNFHLWLKKIFQSAQKPFYLDPVAHRILSSFGEVWQKRHVSEASPQWSVRVFGMTFVCAILVALKQGCHTTIPYIMGISGKKKKKTFEVNNRSHLVAQIRGQHPPFISPYWVWSVEDRKKQRWHDSISLSTKYQQINYNDNDRWLIIASSREDSGGEKKYRYRIICTVMGSLYSMKPVI